MSLTLEVEAEEIIEYIFEKCNYFKTLTSLRLRFIGSHRNTGYINTTYQFCKLTCEILPRILSHMKSLQRLDLDLSNEMFYCYQIKDKDVGMLCEGLKELTNLVELRINLSNFDEKENNIRDQSVFYIGRLIEKHNTLKEISLDLSNTNVSLKSVKDLIIQASNLEQLEYLRINVLGNQFCTRGVENLLLEFQKKNKALCKIIA